MRRLAALPAAALAARCRTSFAARCRASFAARFAEVEAGQSRTAVVETLGEPDQAHWFTYHVGIMGPPEVLESVVRGGVILESAEVEEMTWTRPAKGDTVVFRVYVGHVLATTRPPTGAVF